MLEPKRGFYDHFVLMMDFQSLYPSIIREFNICFTTVKHWFVVRDRRRNPDASLQADLPEADAKAGILARVVKVLLDRRKNAKSAMKDERDVRFPLTRHSRQPE